MRCYVIVKTRLVGKMHSGDIIAGKGKATVSESYIKNSKIYASEKCKY